MSVFPIDLAARPTFARRFDDIHRGTDIFAKKGSPVLAVADGDVRKETGERSGLAIHLTDAASGYYYLYAHLDGYEGEFPRAVKAGDLIGYVGTTGNAVGKPPHVHFELHRRDRVAIDPYPKLEALVSRAGLPGLDLTATDPTAQPLKRSPVLPLLAFAACGLVAWKVLR